MGFTRSTTQTDVHSTLGDFPAEDDHLTAEQLKARFDSPATGLKTDLNGLMGELEATSSAASLGANSIADGDTSQANVQAKLEKIYQDLQDAALGEIPDGSITENKLTAEYSGSLAKKDGNIQTGLNADQLDGYHASSFALKNGNLQSGLNSEKLGGSTLAQVLNTVNSRTSAADLTFSSSTDTTKTFTTKSRFVFFCCGTGTTASYSYEIGLFDCKNNNFLLALRPNSVDSQIRVFTSSVNCGNSCTVKNVSCSSNTVTFGIDISGSNTAHVKVMFVDGLLPN